MAPTPLRSRRPPLAVLPNGIQSPLADPLRTFTMDANSADPEKALNDLAGTKRSASELNAAYSNDSIAIPMHKPSESPHHNKKSRRSSGKRADRKVSFGGQQIKVYPREDECSPAKDAHNVPARPYPFKASPGSIRHLRRLNQPALPEEDDTDTITLPEAPEIPTSHPSSRHLGLGDMDGSSMSPLLSRYADEESNRNSFFFDGDVTMRNQPRLSTNFGLGDDASSRLSILPDAHVEGLHSPGKSDTTLNGEELRNLLGEDEDEHGAERNVSANTEDVSSPNSSSVDRDEFPESLELIATGMRPSLVGGNSQAGVVLPLLEGKIESRAGQHIHQSPEPRSTSLSDDRNAAREANNKLKSTSLPGTKASTADGDHTSGGADENEEPTVESDHTALPVASAGVKQSNRFSVGDITCVVPKLYNLEEDNTEALEITVEDSNSGEPEVVPEKDVPAASIIQEKKIPPSKSKPPLRPMLPESRRLFNHESAPDEDTTIHFYDNDTIGTENSKPAIMSTTESTSTPKMVQTSQPQANNVQEKRTPFAPISTIPSTPQSATASKLRAAMESRPSASKGSGSKKLMELSSSVPRSTKLKSLDSPLQPKSGTTEKVSQHHTESSIVSKPRASHTDNAIVKKPPPEPNFRISNFLSVSNVHFESNLLRRHEDSLGVGLSAPSEGVRTGLEGRLLETTRKKAILERLENEIVQLRSTIGTTDENIGSLENQIESSSPPLYAILRESATLKLDKLTKIQLELKRLRKVCALKARQEWVRYRHGWEREICDEVRKQATVLRHDLGHLQSSKEKMSTLLSAMAQECQELGLDQDTVINTDDNSTGVVDALRDVVREEYDSVKGLRQQLLDHESLKQSLSEEKESLRLKGTSLAKNCQSLQEYANADSSVKLKGIIKQRSVLNKITSKAASISASTITANDIVICVSGVMEVHLRLEGDKISKVHCRCTNSSSGENMKVIQEFTNHAVRLVQTEYLEPLSTVQSIPVALQFSVEALTRAKWSFAEAHSYFESHLGKIVSSRLSSGDCQSLDLTVMASFYSLSLRWKFHVTLTISTFMSRKTFSRQRVTIDNLSRCIGECVSEEKLNQVLTRRGFSSSSSSFSCKEAFAGVWEML